MDCPKCTGSLEPLSIRDTIHLHRCSDCFGLWTRPEALAGLKEEWMSEALVDVGSPKVGRELNRVKAVECPEGHGPMTRRVDEEQPHISFEECTTCGGIFLDAGEFTDLKFKTMLDWMKSLVITRNL